MSSVFREHEYLSPEVLGSACEEALREKVCAPEYCAEPKHLSEVECLGIDYDFRRRMLRAGYYVGVERIPGTDLPLIIHAKMERISYLKMFLHCLKRPELLDSGLLAELYHIDTDAAPLRVATDEFEITPMLIAHYVASLQRLVKGGLKHDYTAVTENLKAKIKGKLLLSEQIRHNCTRGRETHNVCRYRVYDEDCPENRLLKCALRYALRYLQSHVCDEHLLQAVVRLLPRFARVGDRTGPEEIRKIRIPPLYRRYAETIGLARTLLKRFGFDLSLAEGAADTCVLPFRIDMPRLFELYAYSLLADEIDDLSYQAAGAYGKVDFLSRSRKMLIDTKYKPAYGTREIRGEEQNFTVEGRYDIHDIRQLSGYARDRGLLQKIGIEECDREHTLPLCLIVYPLDTPAAPAAPLLQPNTSAPAPMPDVATPVLQPNTAKPIPQQNAVKFLSLPDAMEIPQFVRFFKLGLPLPTR